MAAIYQWFVGHEIVVTTTPYPVDVAEAMVFGVNITASSMDALPEEHVTGNADLISGYHYQSRWFYTDGPYEDAVQSSADMVDGYHYQARWFYLDGPYEDSTQASADLISGYAYQSVVEADTPDEKLYLTCVISNTCSMTGI